MLNNTNSGFKTIQILNTLGGQFKRHAAARCKITRRFDWHGTLKARAFKGSPRAALRLARGVALAIGIALCSASPAGMAQQMPKLTPAKYSTSMIGELQTSCLFAIAKRESNIRYNAINRSSGASGAWQFMNVKVRKLDPFEQVEWAIRYAESRYGSACNAWEYWQRNYWW